MLKNSSKEIRRFNHLHSEIEAAYHDSSLKLGISDSVSIILYTLCNAGDRFPLSKICQNTGLSRQTVHSAIRSLERDGIVYLEAVDGKSKRVCLTEKGKQFAAETAFRLIEIENAIFESWPDSDVEKYLELTEKFLTSLREKVEQL